MNDYDKLNRMQSNMLYGEVLKTGDVDALRTLCQEDLFFLLAIVCNRKDMNNDWLYDRCREVKKNPDGYLDLWAREHYKSTIITFGLTIQDILNNPEMTFCILSHTRPIAKSFLEQIKTELQNNDTLKDLFPDILYKNPEKESPKWSLDDGILVKRLSNPNAKTIEAWGLVDSQPISKHYDRLIYDDVVTRASVANPEQIKKVTDSWAMSLNLGAKGGQRRYIGTRYHINDTYREMMKREAAIVRKYPATHNGKVDGEPVFMSREQLSEKHREMGSYIYASQMLQDPTEDTAAGFKEEWLKYYMKRPDLRKCNIYITVDPAGERKKENDYTVILVHALAPDKNYYLIDGIRDRLNLTGRTEKLFYFVEEYQPLMVGYEKYGLQSDIEHIEDRMEQLNYRFNIKSLGGNTFAKRDRIRKLVPVFEYGRYWLPHNLIFIDCQGKTRDLVHEFITDEYYAFPVAIHDDIFDCKARILDPDLGAKFPVESTTYNPIDIESIQKRTNEKRGLNRLRKAS